jgi:hypothetical protein
MAETDEVAASPPQAEPEPDRGAAPFLAQCPEIEIERVTYRLKRMGVVQCQELLRIAGTLALKAGVDSSAVSPALSENSAGMAGLGGLLLATSEAMPALLGFAARNLVRLLPNGAEQAVSPQELAEPAQFPAYWLLRWVGALKDHPDWVLFFAEAEKLVPGVSRLTRTLASRLQSLGSAIPAGPTIN